MLRIVCLCTLSASLDFRLDDRAVRRAGLDYWPEVSLQRHADLDSLWQELPQARFVYLSTKGERLYTDWAFRA